VESIPVFLLSPAKILPLGGLPDKLLSDSQYSLARNGLCVFRNNTDRSCTIHAHKPFGCSLLICSRMTKAKPLMLNKTYYYHRWLDSQDILFSIFPELALLHRKLLSTVFPLPAPGRSRTAALMTANAIIGTEMFEMMNGRRPQEGSFYKTQNSAPN
jgi:hypothetical protein